MANEYMQDMLTRQGDRFAGNNVADEAQDWSDHDFGVDDASDWCDIGVWDAATAAEFRDAELTPDQVDAAAERLVEGLEDPTDEYTDGDPLYSACNGDTPIEEIVAAAGVSR